MYALEIRVDNETHRVPMQRVADLLGENLSNPNTYELLAIKSGVAKAFDVALDNVTVLLEGQPIL
jgi:hypothetical protein